MKTQTLPQAIEHFLVCCRAEAKSPQTIRWYGQKLSYFTCVAEGEQTPLCEIDRDQIRAFLGHLQFDVQSGQNNPHKPVQDKGLSGHTVHGYARALKAFFSWAERERLIARSPMLNMKMPKLPSLVMPSFSDDEIRCLLDRKTFDGNMGTRNHTMMSLLLDTGIRVSELVGLRVIDVHLGEGYFVVCGKGNKQRHVPMGLRSQTLLNEYLRQHRPKPASPLLNNVFLTQHGKPITSNWVYKIVALTCERAGIRGKRLGPHTCRHSFARSFLLNGGDLLTLQRILGHSSLEVVRGYVHLNTQDLLAQQRRFSPVDRLGAPS